MSSEPFGSCTPPMRRQRRYSPQSSKIVLVLMVLLGCVSILATHAWPANRWVIECVDCPKEFNRPSDRALALDAGGHPHIAHGGDHLYYALHDDSNRHYETADIFRWHCPGFPVKIRSRNYDREGRFSVAKSMPSPDRACADATSDAHCDVMLGLERAGRDCPEVTVIRSPVCRTCEWAWCRRGPSRSLIGSARAMFPRASTSPPPGRGKTKCCTRSRVRCSR